MHFITHELLIIYKCIYILIIIYIFMDVCKNMGNVVKGYTPV